MKTEQEVREAITQGIIRWVKDRYIDSKGNLIERVPEMFITAEEVQDLAVIIGKSLGVVK